MKNTSISLIIVTILIALSSCQKKSGEKEILSFKFVSLNVEASIDDKNIVATVPFGTEVTSLVPVISISDKATVEPDSGVPQDFTHPVMYTVTAEDGSCSSYLVVVNVTTPEASFFGVWGVERIDYYSVDYAGNPIVSTMETFTYDPNSADNGVQMVFRDDKSGEIRDSTVDTIWIGNDYVITLDTTMVTRYNYSFDFENSILYLGLEHGRTIALHIMEQSAESFVYEHEYAQDYIEKAYLRRVSFVPPDKLRFTDLSWDRLDKDGPLFWK